MTNEALRVSNINPDTGKFTIFGRIAPGGENVRNIQFEWVKVPGCVVTSVKLHAHLGNHRRNQNVRITGMANGKSPLVVKLAHRLPKNLIAGDLAITLRGPTGAEYHEIEITATATNWSPQGSGEQTPDIEPEPVELDDGDLVDLEPAGGPVVENGKDMIDA